MTANVWYDPEWCEKCREYRPCSTCTYAKCEHCGRPRPYAQHSVAVQHGAALPDSRMCWGGGDCKELEAFYRTDLGRLYRRSQKAAPDQDGE